MCDHLLYDDLSFQEMVELIHFFENDGKENNKMDKTQEIYEMLKACKDGGSDRLSAVAYVSKTLGLGSLHDVQEVSRMVAPIDKWPKRA